MSEWTLPDRPDSPVYTEVWETIVHDKDRRRAHARLRAVAEADFWAFCKWVTSFGRYKIRDAGHGHRGRLWVDEPFVFDRCRELQRDADEGADDVFYNWARFFFKGLALDTPVPTPGGWRLHGDLKIGDEVFALDGSVAKVIGTSGLKHLECYRIKFQCGEEIVADCEHRWIVEKKSRARLKSGKRAGYRRVVMTTKELAEHRQSRSDARLRVPIAGPIQHPKKDLPLDPYLLGVWLGDGNSHDGQITNVDAEVWSEIGKAGFKTGWTSKNGQTRYVLGLKSVLREIGVLGKGNKGIPDAYMTAGIEQRRALLQGLMDTDGTVSKDSGQATFNNSNRRLVEQVVELLASLGIRSSTRFYENGHSGYHHVSFKPLPSDKVCRLPRKASLARTPKWSRRHHAIVSVEPCGIIPTSCIAVDHPAHAYLVGRNFIPTHNTELATKNLLLWEIAKDSSLTAAILTHKVDQAGEQMYGGLRDEIEKNKTLPKLWPRVFAADVRAYPLFTNDKLTVLRDPGPREPTISIHSITHQPTSGHYRRILVDDAVVRRTVETQREIDKTVTLMRQATALGQDDTITRWVGTVWDAVDPNMRLLQEGGFFSRRSYHPAYVPKVKGLRWSANADAEKDWLPTLRSPAFLEKWRRKLGPYEFSCQMQGDPVAKGEQGFELAWLREYDRSPAEEVEGKIVHLILDPAGEAEKKDADFWCFRVVGLGSDKKRYNLDLWRERLQLPDALDLLFALVKAWRPTQTWIEEYTGQGYRPAIEREMEQRGYRFALRKLPALKRSKVGRISILQTVYRRGEIYNPRGGFGHGSGPRYIDALRSATRDPLLGEIRITVHDRRDTYQQFREDEFLKWTPVEGSTLHDDMLDCDAWPAQEEVLRLMEFPEEVKPLAAFDPFSEEYREEQQRAAISGWGW